MSAQYVEPAPRSATPPSRRPVIWYYRSADIAVTNHHLHTDRDRYPLAELDELGTVRGPAHPAVLIATVIAVAQAPIAIPVVAIVRSPLAFLLAAVLLVVPVVVAVVSARRWPPRLELQARYRGRELVLFSCHDERRFGQVSRAVRRAVEALPLR
jgi:hypothetical protein